MAVVLITGGTGVIGSALKDELLSRNYDIIIMTRSPEKYSNTPRVNYAKWDTEKQTIDGDAITKADYIVHLAGEGVADKRWTAKRKKQIVESRINGGTLLVKALRENINNVRAVVSASGIGWYGSPALTVADGRGTEKNPFEETDPVAEDFLGTTCKEWEASIDPVISLGKRLVKFRTGPVLSKDSGAIKEFKRPLRFGIATILGNGKQIMSWIHIDDLVRLYSYAIEMERLNGIYNAVAPHPAANKKMILQLARTMRGKFYVPVFIPSFILKIVFGELSIEVLKSAAVSCKKIKGEGYHFLYPSLTAALHHVK
ncbi:MAG TPA: TIGR01777 family oxidoreductase [Chitinophagaceae bacterium]|jgi:uncharacterized protein|nr:TIGR01777 family oxidoreductase [Chitinophagaceae bacterium]